MVARHYMDMDTEPARSVPPAGSPFPIVFAAGRALSPPCLRFGLGVESLLLHQQVRGGGVVEVSVAQ